MKLRAACVVFVLLSLAQFTFAQSATETATVSSDAAAPQSNAAPTLSGGGTKHYVPLWLSSGKLGNSELFQTAGKIGIGTTIPAVTLDVNGEINAATSYNLGGSLFAYGSYANQNAFLGFAGNSTMTGIDNTASGYRALYSNTTGSYNAASGAYALYSNTTSEGNTASGYQALYSNTTGNFNTAIGGGALQNNTGYSNTAIGYYAMVSNTTGADNIAIGISALLSNTTGGGNTAMGLSALIANTTGGANTATGDYALDNNTTGLFNTAIGESALGSNTTGSYNTSLGVSAGPDTGSRNLTNTTAIGANATVSESNALVLGGTGTYAVKVGIGTATPTNVFTIARGAGHAISDSWDTYSSRRWKTNIQTLHDALEKIMQLRGVSYDVKESGKHEVGVIAEEVGTIVPEVVSFEENGKDARGVDYSRLTALLIEATKEQQALIRDQQSEIRNLQERLSKMEGALAAVSHAPESR
jgi:hypothetical protein